MNRDALGSGTGGIAPLTMVKAVFMLFPDLGSGRNFDSRCLGFLCLCRFFAAMLFGAAGFMRGKALPLEFLPAIRALLFLSFVQFFVLSINVLRQFGRYDRVSYRLRDDLFLEAPL